ncbi:MAG: antibiotic biosynthesis monooxygenase [Gammaproteobacteria bacterium]|jgi:quinol monooxygenase YgiN|nr:antibiotic biosynthesis monooxygenase [Gammaproteobacteria bacterium]
MYAIFVAVNVKPEHVPAFEEANTINGKSTVESEPDCFRYDMLRDENNPNRFYFIEFFKNEAALHAHWETPHFKKYWETIGHMLDGEFEERVGMESVYSAVSD